LWKSGSGPTAIGEFKGDFAKQQTEKKTMNIIANARGGVSIP
jgi:hypothetical protein